jgi:hypothetical protein
MFSASPSLELEAGEEVLSVEGTDANLHEIASSRWKAVLGAEFRTISTKRPKSQRLRKGRQCQTSQAFAR